MWGRGLGVGVRVFAHGLSVHKLAVKTTGAQVGGKAAHEILYRPVVENEIQQAILKTLADIAPVAAHRLETYKLEALASLGLDEQPRVALLAADLAPAHLRQ